MMNQEATYVTLKSINMIPQIINMEIIFSRYTFAL